MNALRRRAGDAASDRGAAVLTVVLLLLALTAVSATVAVVASNDVLNSGRDRRAASAMATADAGVAQALEYIKSNAVAGITCLESQSSPPTGACATNPPGWTSPTSPQQVNVDGSAGACTGTTRCYRVWISAVTPYNPPWVRTGVYRVHSTGYERGGPATKAVIVDIEASPEQFPIGVYGESLDGNGGTALTNTSLFTRDCVSPRWTGSGNGTRITGVDAFWDQPAAAHSATYVSSATNCGASGYIHRSGVCATGTGNALIYDQDSQGGPVAPGSPCYRTYTRADGSTYPDGDTTKFTLEDLQRYGYRPGGLSTAEYGELKARAQAAGTYNQTNLAALKTAISAAIAAGSSHPVVYFEDVNVSLQASDLPASLGRAPGSGCVAPYSVIFVVRRGDLTYQSGTSEWRSVNFFVPEGTFDGSGGYNVLGTLFANNITLGGNQNFQLDDCFVDNLPGSLFDLVPRAFREDDRRDVN